MTNLTDDIKLFIVQQLACHNSPSQVADDVYEEFGIKLVIILPVLEVEILLMLMVGMDTTRFQYS